MPPTPRAEELIKEFYSPAKGKAVKFTRITGGIFEAAYNRFDSWTETVAYHKNGIPWTITLVEITDGVSVHAFVREYQNSTQIVNFYEWKKPIFYGQPGGLLAKTDLYLFQQDSIHFDLGSAKFAEFQRELEGFFGSFEDIAHQPFKITFFYPSTPLNIQRANVLKEYIGKLGARSGGNSIVFLPQSGVGGIWIEPWF